MNHVTIYTDGACSGNPGPGGWGAVLTSGNLRKEISGGSNLTTNNRMELTAAIEALSALKTQCVVTLYSDSQYLVNGITKGWAYNWRHNGWRNSSKKPVQNPDLWERLLGLISIHDVKFIWVKGHADNQENNRCDELAVAQSQKYKLP